MLLAGAAGCTAIWGAAGGADGGVTTVAAGERLGAAAFGAVLLSLFGAADDGAFGSSAGAADGLASSDAGDVDFSSAPFDVSAVAVGGVAFDSAGGRVDDGGASMRVSVSFVSIGPPKNLNARYPPTANSPTIPMTTTTNPAFLGSAL